MVVAGRGREVHGPARNLSVEGEDGGVRVEVAINSRGDVP